MLPAKKNSIALVTNDDITESVKYWKQVGGMRDIKRKNKSGGSDN